MTPSDSIDRKRSLFSSRRRDRRIGFGDLLAALSRALAERADVSLMRGAFEEMLHRMVPVQSVQLRDGRSRWY